MQTKFYVHVYISQLADTTAKINVGPDNTKRRSTQPQNRTVQLAEPSTRCVSPRFTASKDPGNRQFQTQKPAGCLWLDRIDGLDLWR